MKLAKISSLKNNRRIAVSVFFTASLYALLPNAHASSDDYCGANFSLNNTYYDGCAVNFPTLDVGNDTQTNLYWLLADSGLIDFTTPPKPSDDSYFAPSFPLELSDLRTTAVNNVKNPLQKFLPNDEKNTEAEYCNSFHTGIDDLEKALKLDTSLTTTERQQLLAFRQTIHNNCQSLTAESDEKATDLPPDNLPGQWSANAQPYADYIMATQFFYTGGNSNQQNNFDSADELYRALTHLQNPNNNPGLSWLIETADYMLIRTGINRLYRSGMGEYTYETAKANPDIANSTQQRLESYLKRYPNGRYTASARGLQRRLYWLTGQQRQLIAEITWQLHHTNSPMFNLDSRYLPEEIERKVFFTDHDHPLDINLLDDPILLTSYALSRLRPQQVDSDPVPLTLNELENLKPKFASRPDLYQYLLASYYVFTQNNPLQALSYLPNDLPSTTKVNEKLNYLTFSRYTLKARALEMLGQNAAALTLWHALHKLPKQPYQATLTELALAIQGDRSNDYSELFGSHATIHNNALKLQVIRFSADPNLLTQISDSLPATDEIGAEARYALLTKSLLQGQYNDFLHYQQQYLPKNAQDYQAYDSKNEALKKLPKFSSFIWQGKKISPSLTCQNLTATVSKLSQTPNDRLATLCLSEFMYDTDLVSYFEDYGKSDYASSAKPKTYQFPRLGDIPSRFAGTPMNRLEMYQSLFATGAKDELSAYALHRAIGCFASSGNNQCGGKSVDLSVRKAWYNRLKSDFGNTSWAKNQKYYW